jgi:hypothetical protein
MRRLNTILFTREDLSNEYKSIDFNDIKLDHFSTYQNGLYKKENLYIFVDLEKKIKVLLLSY